MNETTSQKPPEQPGASPSCAEATGSGLWRDISSAPRDGSKILLVDASGDMAVAKWDSVSMGDGKGWQISCVATDWNYYEEMDHPTHWMPLPDAPNTEVRQPPTENR